MTDLEAMLAGSASEREHDAMARLRAEVARRATTDGILDVAYRTIDSPVGPLLLAATPDGLVRVGFDHEGHDAVLGSLAARISPRILFAPARFDVVARQVDDYFAGRRQSFDVPLDLRLRAGFRRSVLERLRAVPYGSTISYRGLAGTLGAPGASRAVGTACATNPLPIVIPCHRVVRTDGGLGGYLGGVAAKRLLLDLEASRAG
jgi:methylated-DNA-[protein]-cysteine S-methyltransferase